MLLRENRNWVRIFLSAMVGLSGAALLPLRAAHAEEKKQKTELNKKMEEIDDGMKKLKRSLRKADQNAQSLELVVKIEEAALICKGMTPSRATTMPTDQQPKFVADYRKEMLLLVETMCKMEAALLDGDNAKAQSIYKELKTQEEDGHDKFMPADDKPDDSKGDKK